MVSSLVNLGVLHMDNGQHSSLPFSTGITSWKLPSSFSIASLPEILLFPWDSLLPTSLTQEVLCTQIREEVRSYTIRRERERTAHPPGISSVGPSWLAILGVSCYITSSTTMMWAAGQCAWRRGSRGVRGAGRRRTVSLCP